MLRNRLRTLEQQVNASDLPDDVKVKLQAYVSGCYGSLTSFNVLFADDATSSRAAEQIRQTCATDTALLALGRLSRWRLPRLRRTECRSRSYPTNRKRAAAGTVIAVAGDDEPCGPDGTLKGPGVSIA